LSYLRFMLCRDKSVLKRNIPRPPYLLTPVNIRQSRQKNPLNWAQRRRFVGVNVGFSGMAESSRSAAEGGRDNTEGREERRRSGGARRGSLPLISFGKRPRGGATRGNTDRSDGGEGKGRGGEGGIYFSCGFLDRLLQSSPGPTILSLRSEGIFINAFNHI